MQLKIKLLDNNCMPFKKHIDDAGFDLRANINKLVLSVGQFQTVCIPSGMCVEIPQGYVGHVLPRSSLAKQGVVAEIGTIDTGYTGEVQIIITNNSNVPFHIVKYDRIAQLIVSPIANISALEVVQTLNESERSNNGFGSTGVK